jgi:hypothetical protein
MEQPTLAMIRDHRCPTEIIPVESPSNRKLPSCKQSKAGTRHTIREVVFARMTVSKSNLSFGPL